MMRYAFVTVLLLALTTGGASTQSPAQSVDAALKAEVEAVAARLTDGYARFEGVTQVTRGAENTPLAGRVVVLFGMTAWGGGNGLRQFLAVLDHHDSIPAGGPARPYSLFAMTTVGRDFDRLRTLVSDVMEGRSKQGRRPHLWDGKAAERICEILVKA